ncbi:histidine kinase [Paenibacillus sp. J5C_2022]|uniref:hybrid sensor histidine kinase/response regulator n=1 Tax=Paenibacillus sp. J5C2022 TaxID=2977129 RepID=UPI0021D3128A|nr:histidine kinase [Paenibacillus sp. J5C2022]MCU6711444.1 histidine kinase [Paenibacillus sp. J5C2022]
MTWMKDRLWLFLLLMLVSVVAVVWAMKEPTDKLWSIEQGTLDLQGWDPEAHGVIQLDGEWTFYPGMLVSPDDMLQYAGPKTFIAVPGNWRGIEFALGQAPMKGHGYGTYRLQIRNAPEGVPLGLDKSYVRFADKLYVNGIAAGESGRVGESKENYIPRNIPYVGYFQSDDGIIDILLQTSNFDYKDGGISRSITFGLAKDIEIRRTLKSSIDVSGTFLFLLFSILLLLAYIWNRRSSILLQLAVYFLLFAMQFLLNGERLFMHWFSGVPFELAFKLKGLAVFTALSLSLFLIWKLLKRQRFSGWILGYSLLLAAYCLFVLLLPYSMYSYRQDLMYVLATAAYIHALAFAVAAYIRRSYGSINQRQFQLFIAAIWTLLMTNAIVIANNLHYIPMETVVITVLFLGIIIVSLFLYQYVLAYSALTRMTAQLQMADRMKDEFLLMTSHELNTPLHHIMSLSRSLIPGPMKRASAQEMEDKLQFIHDTAYRLSSMVKDIIDTDRLREGTLQLTLQRVDLIGCLTVLLEVSGHMAREWRVECIHAIDPAARFVLADEARLMQVLYHSMLYSLGHAGGGKLYIRGMVLQDHTVVELTAVDGAEKPIVAESRLEGSFTTGLSIARELIGHMGGSWRQDHASGTIVITMLRADGPTAYAESAASVAASLDWEREKSKTEAARGKLNRYDREREVLVASSDMIIIEHLNRMLEGDGYRVAAAVSAEEAYERMTTVDRPDIVLIDVGLSDGQGYGLCRRIRERFSQADLPVLLISARMTPLDIETGLEAGGSDFVMKPLDAGEIRMRINTLLSMKQLVKDAARNEMAFLRSQIKPHFLYNALGTIMSLCYTNGERAGELLGVFSRYLRIIFHMDITEETVMLSKEMELIRAYIDIERERFGDRVRVLFDVDESLYGAYIMPLTIEPLVENAIRHGLSRKMGGGTVRLAVSRLGQYMQVVVEDDGIGMSEEQVKCILNQDKGVDGIGFRNIIRRVSHFTDQHPVIESAPGHGTKVVLMLPILSRKDASR